VRRALPAALLASLALLAAGCGTGGPVEDGDANAGQKLFAANCGGCHALKNAGTNGNIGPNLDAAFAAAQERDYPESTIRNVVGMQIKYPNSSPETGAAGMPPNLVKGQDVDDVASYVACVAGISEAEAKTNGCPAAVGSAGGGGAGGGAGGGTDGKAIFNGPSGCSGCHTLQAAGSSGTIGPNLDQSKIDEAGAIKQIQNGGGPMPAFKDTLTDKQIKAVAHFVVTSRSG
jgi:mono/diheme cytochrome c family protein